MLDEQFSEDETLRQLETAINWGRYAELFDFDASRRRFVLPEEEETPEAVEEAQTDERADLPLSHAFPFAGIGADLALFSRPQRRRKWAGPLLRRPAYCAILDGASGSRGRHLQFRKMLPLYAFYSVVRIGVAYLLSLIFAVGYGYIAAYNPRVEAFMIAMLDILQSIPVLSFLPP